MQRDYPGADAFSMKKSSPFAGNSATLHQVAYKISIRFHQACTFFTTQFDRSHCSCLRLNWNFPVAFPSTLGTSAFSIAEGKLPYHKMPIVVYSSWRQKAEWTKGENPDSFIKLSSRHFFGSALISTRCTRAWKLGVCERISRLFHFIADSARRLFHDGTFFVNFFSIDKFLGREKAKIGEKKQRHSQSVLGLVRYQLFSWADWRSD